MGGGKLAQDLTAGSPTHQPLPTVLCVYVSHLAADGTGRGLLPVLGGLLAAHLQLLSLHVLGAWAETQGGGHTPGERGPRSAL